MRRTQDVLLAGLWFALIGCGTQAHDEPGPNHNLILICADTLRSDHLGLSGYGRDTSPNLDKLAARGARFERCFSSYPQTAASVASIFTSLYPSAHKVSEKEMLLSEVPLLLTESLGQAGYRTAAVSTNPHLTPGLGFERGFDDYIYIHGRNQKRSSYQVPGAEHQAGVEFRQSKGSYYGRGDDVNLAALEWLDASSSERPFYLYLHYMDVHSPYISPQPFQDQFTKDGGRNVYQIGLPKGRPTRANRDFTEARYDGGVAYLDHLLGQLVQSLDERGLLASTFLVFTADHGDEFMEHGGFGHAETLYREMHQVPLIFSGPGLQAAVFDEAVSTLDIYPTICGLLGLPTPTGLLGRSHASALRTPGQALPIFPTHAYTEGHATRSAGGEFEARIGLFDERWHLIMRPGEARGELFDYLADPRESQNLWDEHPAEVERLRQRAQHLRQTSQAIGASIIGQQAELSAGTKDALNELGYGAKDEDEE